MSVISLWASLAGIARPYPADSRTLAGVVLVGADITGKIHAAWLVQMVLGAALNLKILYHLIRLMVMYAKGKLFTAQSVAQIRLIGLTFACGLAIWLVVLIGAAPEIAAAQDQWTKIMPSFPGGAPSRIMDEGRKLQLNTVAERVGIMPQNLSVLNAGRARFASAHSRKCAKC